MGTTVHESWIGDEALARLPEFLTIEGSGWKGRAQTHIDSAEKLRAFYQTLAQRLSSAGWLGIDLMRVGKIAVAGQLCIHCGVTQFVQKIAYDETFAKHSPGHVLWEHFVQRCCEDPQTDMIDTIGTDRIRERWKCDGYDYDDLYFFRSGFCGSVARRRTIIRAALGKTSRRWRSRDED